MSLNTKAMTARTKSRWISDAPMWKAKNPKAHKMTRTMMMASNIFLP